MYFFQLMDVLMQFDRFEEMEQLGVAAFIHPAFANEERQKDLRFILAHTCLLSGNGERVFDYLRDLVLDDLNNTQVWNMFAQGMLITNNLRHNRFCLRLMFRYNDHLPLSIMNGHNALVAGTYKHALAEYVAAFKASPEDPFLSLCIGVTFAHLASQKFASKRHSLTVQCIAFLKQYLDLRGACQESYFNLGRATHQLGE